MQRLFSVEEPLFQGCGAQLRARPCAQGSMQAPTQAATGWWSPEEKTAWPGVVPELREVPEGHLTPSQGQEGSPERVTSTSGPLIILVPHRSYSLKILYISLLSLANVSQAERQHLAQGSSPNARGKQHGLGSPTQTQPWGHPAFTFSLCLGARPADTGQSRFEKYTAPTGLSPWVVTMLGTRAEGTLGTADSQGCF